MPNSIARTGRIDFCKHPKRNTDLPGTRLGYINDSIERICVLRFVRKKYCSHQLVHTSYFRGFGPAGRAGLCAILATVGTETVYPMHAGTVPVSCIFTKSNPRRATVIGGCKTAHRAPISIRIAVKLVTKEHWTHIIATDQTLHHCTHHHTHSAHPHQVILSQPASDTARQRPRARAYGPRRRRANCQRAARAPKRLLPRPR